MSRVITLATLSLLVASQAGAQRIVGRDDRTFSLDEVVDRGDWVRIASPNGFVRITESSGRRVEIRAEKEVRRGSIEDVGFVVRQGRGGLTVCAVYEDEDECTADGEYRGRRSGWTRNRQIRINFTVQVPSGVRVQAGTGNGDVSVSGGVSEVVASTGNGRVDVSETTGEVKASSGNGRVTVEGAGGPVEVSTGNGDIRVVTAAGPVSANSGNGDIDVSMDRLPGSPDMRFTTGNGKIVVRVPEGFDAELQSSTGNGRISVDFPIEVRAGRLERSRLRGTIGSGGGRLVLTSGNGSISLLRSR